MTPFLCLPQSGVWQETHSNQRKEGRSLLCCLFLSPSSLLGDMRAWRCSRPHRKQQGGKTAGAAPDGITESPYQSWTDHPWTFCFLLKLQESCLRVLEIEDNFNTTKYLLEPSPFLTECQHQESGARKEAGRHSRGIIARKIHDQI